ncbi:uncharacterized protein L3040_000269 [Drepanopeziza brunnea f. sp. 'multigermtubi']|uniref:tRNA wybutosine-synthesizing protein 4 n=1 Tax=Marssonina brunnea f. sp. multigermtubi (strain MB_m1) TaxID=1072389 RepID=K1WHG2_MARBU|nr:leucine carboxyl methyltransferase [Drepanopeziza brunnea f. sp. 'multigermtubi' MB_m1]EKD12261.1 leucine carboxyl methyltransferase [Drepanopeziza brunnea f. sp. 'multigermtubi' MB_m1]KAJ5053981.1 hypothetical protein L3040_000269 [Drepanopeziza brunnea f. sp. 'multigermtubi']
MAAPAAIGGSLPARVAKSKAQNQDDSIMGTNNSSIVSKRSVERIYYPNEPQFFRHFVKKPQRRSPLINRGYWLRMKAIDQVVRQFLEQESEKQKVVINLGCGYDPLPWQCFHRCPKACVGAKFIDIDYKDLILKKRAVVQSTYELNSMLANVELSEGDVLFRSDQYVQLGCDLRDLVALKRVLTDVVDINKCLILFTAEVSITYMNVEAADCLIAWASNLPEARFCLLEQLIPDGNEHPFSQTMMAHFDKLQTPLGAVKKYPTEYDQRGRFHGLGWPNVSICNLWKLWSSPKFISSEERRSLDTIEPFDEWEEFALFGSHYFLLVADKSNNDACTIWAEVQEEQEAFLAPINGVGSGIEVKSVFSKYPKAHGYRRFAASMPLKGQDRSHDRIGVFGGMGLTTRTDSYDEYSTETIEPRTVNSHGSDTTPSSRMCHTMTDLGDISLLVGGRNSPDNASKECWLFHKWLNTWERVEDLPWPLYRHQATYLGHGFVLVSPGRIDSRTISESFIIWHRRTGWVECAYSGESRLPPSYGGVFFSSKAESLRDLKDDRYGFIAGGMSIDSCVLGDVWKWSLQGLSSKKPTISFRRFENFKSNNLVARFGATAVEYQGNTYIVGGIIPDEILGSTKELCVFRMEGDTASVSVVDPGLNPRPLLIGSTVVASGQSLVITGGSAVCFSFGTYWNKGCYTLHTELSESCMSGASGLDSKAESTEIWKLAQTVAAQTPPKIPVTPNTTDPVTMTSISRVQLRSATDFSQALQTSAPIIFEKVDLGPCVQSWTMGYLKEKVGIDREVIVHEASTEHMDFKSKNFKYTPKRFGDFLDQVETGEKLYLRSLSSDKPSEQPADIARDFPFISADFRLPSELSFVADNAHSSPLRISGSVNMWLHYDVMANVYCQVRGSKRLLLFPPSDVTHLQFEPGSSSSHINVFEEIANSRLGGTHPHEAILQPGDILFLPPLWLHTASAASGVSIAVNVFFRNLSTGYAAGKDVYGNRDLQAYEKGRQDIAKIVKSFAGLPRDVTGFYLQRLADELAQKV